MAILCGVDGSIRVTGAVLFNEVAEAFEVATHRGVPSRVCVTGVALFTKVDEAFEVTSYCGALGGFCVTGGALLTEEAEAFEVAKRRSPAGGFARIWEGADCRDHDSILSSANGSSQNSVSNLHSK